MLAIGILLFALLIIVHELGHFWAARRSGVEVEEFGIGFPPRLLSRRIGRSRTLYSFNLIPLGGFVRLKGENNEDKRPKTFGATSYVNKVKILLAGVGMNVLAAFVILLVLSWTGLPQIVPGQFSISGDERLITEEVVIASVLEGSAAASAGLSQGDSIISINGQTLDSSQDLIDFTKQRPGESVALTWQHLDEVKNQTVKLERNERGEGQLGVVPFEEKLVRYSWAAPLVALGLTLQLLWLTLVGLGQLLVGLLSEGTSSAAAAGAVGPVGLVALLNSAGDFGLTYVMVLIVVISVSLAVINALPIPALDGGRLALISLFKWLKKPLTERLESTIHMIGFVALLMLAALISYFDIVRFF